MTTDETKSNRWKSVSSILVIIFLGAIGSGVWDLFLKDTFYVMGTFFVSVMSSLYSGYIDSLYEHVGAQSNFLAYLPSIFVFSLIITSPLYFYMRLKRILRKFKSHSDTRSHQSKSFRSVYYFAIKKPNIFLNLAILPFLLCSLLYFNLFIVASNNLAATKGMERWLDIIRPHMVEREYYQIVSEFRLIESAKDYQSLVTKIEDHAEEMPIKLPPLRVFGIETRIIESEDGV